MAHFNFELHWIDIPNVPNTLKSNRSLARVDTQVFHRIHAGAPDTDSAIDISRLSTREGPQWIGSSHMPYHFVIPKAQPTGKVVIVEACVPLTRITPHALDWNARSVSVGVVGDFRERAPTAKQKAACLWITQRIKDFLTPSMRLVPRKREFLVTVHSSLTSGTRNPAKLAGGTDECPGPFFTPTWREIRKTIALSGGLA